MRNIIIIVILALVLAGGILLFYKPPQNPAQITNFEECAAAGNPIMESYPRQCSFEGKTFVEKIENGDGGGLCIQVITPAKDPETGEIVEFPTPCDVPEGWIKVED